MVALSPEAIVAGVVALLYIGRMWGIKSENSIDKRDYRNGARFVEEGQERSKRIKSE